MALLEDVTKLLNDVDDLSEQTFFCEDSASYPNNDNLLELEVKARLIGSDNELDNVDLCDDDRQNYADLIKLATGITYKCIEQVGGELFGT